MKIKITTLKENDDYREGITFEIDDKITASFIDGGEPEDNRLCRDWNDIYKFEEMLKLAYEAGKNNEELEIEEVEIDIDEYFNK